MCVIIEVTVVWAVAPNIIIIFATFITWVACVLRSILITITATIGSRCAVVRSCTFTFAVTVFCSMS